MKKIITIIMLAFCAIANAQTYMKVNQKDGTVLKILVYDIDSVTWKSKYVDLGLSVMWATCNVGASSPEEYGDYFAWGETTGFNEGKTTFDMSTYTFCTGKLFKYTKYCTNSSRGTVDNKTVLESSDDAAHVNWGGDWRMPTYEEFEELQENCTWTWTTQNGVNGYKVKSKVNDNFIFLPAAGHRSGSDLLHLGSGGYYWTNSLFGIDSSFANGFEFDSSDEDFMNDDRCDGQSVRAVCP